MKILITGATGLIGSQLVKDCLKNKIIVNFLTTQKSKLNYFENATGFYWNPKTKEIDGRCFEGVNSIINLSGASIFRFWTNKNKSLILKSRVHSLDFLKKYITENSLKIDSLISASGIGSYPESALKEFDELEKEKSDYFLADVIKKWEDAALEFKPIIKNISVIRIGLVLSKEGGVLKQTIQPMRFGFGVYFGSGRQWQSWIHVEDISRIFIHILKNNLSGIFNGVSPNPVSNFEFTSVISKIKRNVLFLIPIPRIFFKIIFGKMHVILFKNQKVSSKKIILSGFNFNHRFIEEAIKNIFK